MTERGSPATWQVRALAGSVGVVAVGLVAFEVIGIAKGLSPHRDTTTLTVGIVLLVQGLLGLPALLLAISATRAFAVVIDPRRSLRTAAFSLALAVPLWLLWLLMYVGTYGS